jgi:hypothetical protein
MIEKINFATKLKERVFTQNICLSSITQLPSEIQKNLKVFLSKFLIYSKNNFIKGNLKILSSKEFFLLKSSNFTLNPQNPVLLILPFKDKRYIFQTFVEEVKSEGYKLKILEPRQDLRFKLKTPVPVFISFIPQNLIYFFLNKNYFLVRESNFCLSEEFEKLKEIYFYDLLFDEKSKIDEQFSKLIEKTFLIGELEDISGEGACVKARGTINFPEEVFLLYLKFSLSVSEIELKFALISHLRNLRFENNFTYFHLMFLMGFKPGIWGKILSIFKTIII